MSQFVELCSYISPAVPTDVQREQHNLKREKHNLFKVTVCFLPAENTGQMRDKDRSGGRSDSGGGKTIP